MLAVEARVAQLQAPARLAACREVGAEQKGSRGGGYASKSTSGGAEGNTEERGKGEENSRERYRHLMEQRGMKRREGKERRTAERERKRGREEEESASEPSSALGLPHLLSKGQGPGSRAGGFDPPRPARLCTRVRRVSEWYLLGYQ